MANDWVVGYHEYSFHGARPWWRRHLSMSLIEEIRVHGPVGTAVYSDEQRAEILAESHLILSHASFKNSKRCVTLFQFLIERALAGDYENLKERTLGVEVFGRNPDYDTNADPIVRMTASEIRKRLAQYYQQGEHPGRTRIQLVPGSYLPHFETVEKDVPEASAEPDSEEEAERHGEPQAAQKKLRRWLLVGGLTLGMLAAGFASWLVTTQRFASTQELVWTPLIHENGPIMLSVSDGHKHSVSVNAASSNWAEDVRRVIAAGKFEPPTSTETESSLPTLPVVDARVAARVTGFLMANHRETSMRETSAMSLADLRQGPDVIIGAFNNPWCLVLLSGLRFHVMVDPATQDEWIADAQNPGRREWIGNGNAQFTASSVDYALISRVRSPDTGTWILGIGGLGLHGTEAAGELVTNPNLSKLLPSSLRDTQKNFQVVIKTDVINGNIGPPQIVATHIW